MAIEQIVACISTRQALHNGLGVASNHCFAATAETAGVHCGRMAGIDIVAIENVGQTDSPRCDGRAIGALCRINACAQGEWRDVSRGGQLIGDGVVADVGATYGVGQRHGFACADILVVGGVAGVAEVARAGDGDVVPSHHATGL